MRTAVVLLLVAGAVSAQSMEDEFRVYTDHPRLFLKAQRLRLLKRERERQSMRWVQFETLIKGVAQMPEPGFAYGLYHAITGDKATGRRAVEWALGPATDIRQTALVFDWCQDLLTPAESKTLGAKLGAALRQPRSEDVRMVRTRTLAAIAVAEQLPDRAEFYMRDAVERWWRKMAAPALENGPGFAPGEDLFALQELMHAVRDNTNIDLRDSAHEYFKQLPAFYVTSHYPAPYPAAENEYRIPVYNGAGQPDLNRAAISRAAGMCIVAYDTNAVENQYVQGWAMQDRFMMRGPFGSPYEFMWANPYQPGLSYSHLPLVFHSNASGTLFIRASWEEDSMWFGLFQREMQVFRDGRVTVLRPAAPNAQTPKVDVGDTATVVLGQPSMRFRAEGGDLFIVNLKPRHHYEVEIEDEEMAEMEADNAGTLHLPLLKETDTAVKLRERSASAGI